METFALDRAAILTLDKTRRFSSSGIERFCLSLPALLARSSTSALGYELLSTHIQPNVSSALRSRLSFCRHRESASGQKRTLAPIGRRCRFSARIIPIADICIECSSTVRPELADVCFRLGSGRHGSHGHARNEKTSLKSRSEPDYSWASIFNKVSVSGSRFFRSHR